MSTATAESTTSSSASSEKSKHLLDGLRRLTDHSPVMMLPRLVMTQHIQQSLADARARLADGHRYQMQLLGEEASDMPREAGITVQGDTTVLNFGGSPASPSRLRRLLPYVLALAAGGGLAALAPLITGTQSSAPSPPPPIVYRLGLIVTDHP